MSAAPTRLVIRGASVLGETTVDLLVVDGNPLDDLDVLHRPSHVIVRGRSYSQADLAPAGTATEPVA